MKSERSRDKDGDRYRQKIRTLRDSLRSLHTNWERDRNPERTQRDRLSRTQGERVQEIETDIV